MSRIGRRKSVNIPLETSDWRMLGEYSRKYRIPVCAIMMKIIEPALAQMRMNKPIFGAFEEGADEEPGWKAPPKTKGKKIHKLIHPSRGRKGLGNG